MKRKLGENEIALPLISRERAESGVPLVDCSGRKYGRNEYQAINKCIAEGMVEILRVGKGKNEQTC